MQSYKTLRLILGDQLNADHSWFKTKDPSVLYVIAELHQEQTYVKHHVQKTCAFFKSMQNFSEALIKAGHHVRHLTLDDTAEYKTLNELLISIATTHHCSVIQYQRPDEYRLLQQLNELSAKTKQTLEITCFDTEHFILPFEDIPKYFNQGKHVRMENFYRAMRKRFNILMENDKPIGDQWNFDADNRNTFKKDDLAAIPQPLIFANEVSDILQRLKRHQIKVMGKQEPNLLWPCSRAQSKKILQHFCTTCLPNFGRFQDAMTQNSDHAWSLYHSRLSFSINTKMLHPLDVIQAAINAFEKSQQNPSIAQINLAQVEGFIRQILGWREYVRGMYWINMPEISSLNALTATRPLPKWFWDGNTKMNCLNKAITQSLNYAYAHHIQRLMITGNFALLTGLNPDDVDAWYLGIYIDAIEWVELPNTRGMALSADGGLIATKPYAASGNYINKMSDHCKSCHYSVKEKTGSKACPFNSLYWHFLDTHKKTFKKNPRMAFPYKTWHRIDEPQQSEILQHAQKLLDNLDTL
ncbi:deoxyribodipyrimidine photolyase [Oleiphilus sp. HI0078]|uniref:cryptochrome/photolyase family protein n=1 Tax=unclassified Oleiphilus TaxID=2631174 RepID=UPI0007C2774C|nr:MULTISPECIES: cryptochrome/photolyase family protein [unclassified Oleiphilus]KZY75940.1 deoxyribodipyrimidine photolyase [Oleiphilus sp. HI0068]KZY80997.1 deoxyribodipyrimidine photolyase [Oleiphilus sp. HI0069]KZY88142.1 deoxyribodipyrimidine photolyase [Oleiphilus sp. HI0072]KZZ11695.1 deoxyribodipyrimidine photolyase [Oleiphilus sp. HI0078]KZY59958.1 deoxyribodipyrimidine photolyase [Oleiphilus sp. HI0061]